MPTSTYEAFTVTLYDDATSSSTPLAGLTVKAYNVTGLADLGTIGTTGADGTIAGGTLSVAGATRVRFRVEDDGHGRGGYANQVTDSGLGQDIVIRPSRGINLVLRPEVLDIAVDGPVVNPAAVILGIRLQTEPASATKEVPGVFPPVGRFKINNFWASDAPVYIHVNPVNGHGVRLYSRISDAPFYPINQQRETNRPTVTQFDTATTSEVTLKVGGFGVYAVYRKVHSASDTSVQQVETATVVGTITGSGNATVQITSAILTGSPLTLHVAVLNTDVDTAVATKIRAALNLNSAITDEFLVGGTGADITLTVIEGVANDTSLNISIVNGTCTGLTNAPTSVNTTAGVAGFSVNFEEELVDLITGVNDKSWQFESITPAVGTQTRYFKVAHSSKGISGPWSPFSTVLSVTFAGTGGGTGSPGDGDPSNPDRRPFGELA